MRPLHYALFSTIVATLAAGPADTSHAAPPGTFSQTPTGPASDAVWVDAHLGFTFGDIITLDESTAISGNDQLAPAFGLAVYYRTARFDFGGLLEHIGSFGFSGLERTNRTGGQFRVAASARWRYIDEHWGSLFLRVSPGLALLRHSDPMRLQMAKIRGENFDHTVTEGLTYAFSIGFDFGTSVYLSKSLALSAHLDIVTASTAVAVAGSEVDYRTIRGLFTLGLEWRL
ncbi:MAG: hypothetical protein ACI9MR_004123 [Myxococcota bacterium]|jgi:hypothetical protein